MHLMLCDLNRSEHVGRIAGLLLLVTILSQTFFTLVSGHLVTFSFLSAGHFIDNVYWLIVLVVMYCWERRLFYLFHEHFRGLECRNLVFGDDDSGVL